MRHGFLIFYTRFVGGDPARNLNREVYAYVKVHWEADLPVRAENSTLSRGILRYAGARAEDPDTPMTAGPQNAVVLNEANLRVSSVIVSSFPIIHQSMISRSL